jgi:hypothetical protein
MSSKNKVVQKVCTMCGGTYPLKDFKRRLSKRQSASLLRRESVQTALTVISSRCRFCWQQTKRKAPLTTKQIKQKKASGDMHATVADILLTQRKQNATAVKSRVMKEYWEKKRQEPIQALEKSLRQQVAKYKNRYQAYKTLVQKSCTTETPQHALLRQHSHNYEQAKQVRNDLLSRAKSGESISPDVLIDVYFKKGGA